VRVHRQRKRWTTALVASFQGLSRWPMVLAREEDKKQQMKPHFSEPCLPIQLADSYVQQQNAVKLLICVVGVGTSPKTPFTSATLLPPNSRVPWYPTKSRRTSTICTVIAFCALSDHAQFLVEPVRHYHAATAFLVFDPHFREH
jgi:hypothetical protein